MTRLPQPGSDNGTWGDILNEFLSVEHNSDGTLKPSGSIQNKEPVITAGTTAQYWRGDKSWQTLDKAAVGLSNVDNTSDANKPVSTAQASALGLKIDKATFDADTILKADSDDTPVALTVGASTIVGRKATGGIVAMSMAELNALLGALLASNNLSDLANATTARSNLGLTTTATKTTPQITQFPAFEVEVGGYLISASSGATGTANAYSTGRMYLEPIDVVTTMTFDRIGTSITVTGSGSGQVIRLGIYNDDGTLSRPAGAPLLDAGTVDPTSGTGDKLITISQQLTPGRYWLAWAIQGTVSSSPTVVTNNIVNQAGLANLGNNSNRVWGHSGVSGALPTIASLFRDSNPPMIGVRRSV